MKAFGAMSHSASSHCTMSAAACTSARLCVIMDTVVCAVSIFILSVLGILVWWM